MTDRPPTAPSEPRGGEERCPECDAVDEWDISRRHRFSPFGSIVLALLSFWSAALGWMFGIGYLPAVFLLLAALVIGIWTRKAEICRKCGFVRPRRA